MTDAGEEDEASGVLIGSLPGEERVMVTAGNKACVLFVPACHCWGQQSKGRPHTQRAVELPVSLAHYKPSSIGSNNTNNTNNTTTNKNNNSM